MVKTILSTTGKEVVASDESAQALHAAEAAGAEVVPSPAALASYEGWTLKLLATASYG